MEIVVKMWKADGMPFGEFLTDNLEDAIAAFSANVKLGFRATIEATPITRFN